MSGEQRPKEPKLKKRPAKAVEAPPAALPTVFTSIYHKVYYRPSQVRLSMSCFREGQIPQVGMRLAMLEQRGECELEHIPHPVFYIGVIEKVSGDLVTVKYDRHPSALSITFGWESTKMFCVPVTGDREAWTGEFEKRQRKEWPT